MQLTVEAVTRADGRIALILGDRILTHIDRAEFPSNGRGDDPASDRPRRSAVKRGGEAAPNGRRLRKNSPPIATLRKAARRIDNGEKVGAVAKNLGLNWHQAKTAGERVAEYDAAGDESGDTDAEDDAGPHVLQFPRDGPAPPRMTRRPRLGRLAERLAVTPELPDPEDKVFRFGLNTRARLGAKQRDLLERQEANIDYAAIDAVVRDAQLRPMAGAAPDPRRDEARVLFQGGLELEEIAVAVKAEVAVLQYWREADDWDHRRAGRRNIDGAMLTMNREGHASAG